MIAPRTTISSAKIPNSSATVIEVTLPSSRVDAMTSAASASISANVISRAVPSSGAMPSSGMRAWLASALFIATTPIARNQNVSQPKNQPTFGFARREAH